MSEAETSAPRRAVALFRRRYGSEPEAVVRSPGRVNLIGGHVDYSEGLVLPIAIDRAVWLAFRPRTDRRVRMYAELTEADTEFDLDLLSQRTGWSAYVEGVAHILSSEGASLAGFDGVVTTDLPAGAGLSSSAALELAAARTFAAVSGLAWSPTDMAVACQRAENEWVGMKCGIMDQLICATGRAGHAMLIDCRSLSTTPTALPRNAAVVVLDTMTRRELVDSQYNLRRIACETAARAFGADVLRDVSMEQLDAGRDRLDEVTYQRARHVISENGRTLQAARALDVGDLAGAGALIRASHTSLRDDFEVSSPALDVMADVANASPSCFGARMTGAGFGGSVVALVDAATVDEFIRATLDAYSDRSNGEGRAMIVTAEDGTALAP